MLNYFLLAGLLTAAPFSSAVANDCSNANTQLELNMCADQEFKETDAELNRVYNRLRVRLNDDAAAKDLLTEAQRAWLAFRDAECAFSTSESAGGSIHPMLVASCRTGLTKDRVDALRDYLEGPGR